MITTPRIPRFAQCMTLFCLGLCAASVSASDRDSETKVVMKRAAALPKVVAQHDKHWSYDGDTGPQHWAALAPENVACESGQRQSPVHLKDEDVLPIAGMAPLQFEYAASSGAVVNNGHTLQVDVRGENLLTVRGTIYKLVQIHFHHPAEERINDRDFAMVAHLVHRSAEGRLAVVAVLLEAGAANPWVQMVWSHMPLDVEDRVTLPEGGLEVKQLLPPTQGYYQFLGSLTTPPCSEGVLWIVLKQTVTLSPQQIAIFAKLFPHNARPTQAIAGRVITSTQE